MGRQNSDLGLVQVWGDTIQILLICAGLGRQNSDTLDLCRFGETKFSYLGSVQVCGDKIQRPSMQI